MDLPDNSDSVRFIQITDPHLMKTKDRKLVGVETFQSLQSVLKQVEDDKKAFDFFVVTGDISQDGSELSYQSLQQSLHPFEKPSYWLAGNHDSPQTMQVVAEGTEHLKNIIRTPHWQILLLNTQVEGQVYGNISETDFELINNALEQHPHLHTLIGLHHHPIAIGSAWMDKIGVKNGEKLMEIARKNNKVKAMIWGHVHQEIDSMDGHTRMISTPSTCVQFAPRSNEFGVDNNAPGYRYLQLNSDGSIETEVVRVDSIELEADLSSSGY